MKIIDGHCDTILRCLNENLSFFDDTETLHLNYNKLENCNIIIQYFALFIESKYKPYYALEQALKLILFFKKHILAQHSFALLKSLKDLEQLGIKKLALLAIEGGEPLGENLDLLDVFFEFGVRSIGLTWNQRNNIANGCGDSNIGLSKFGINVVKKMNNLGMIVDCAHLSERGLKDVLEISTKPILISHANCAEICQHPRNISDENLLLLAQNNGVIGITFVPEFLEVNNPIIENVIKHIAHAIKVAGIDHVALGSDFDGCDKLPKGIEGGQSFPAIIELMRKYGLTKEEINKITFENQLRLIKMNLPN